MAAKYGKVTISGTSVGQEVWSTSFCLIPSPDPSGWNQTIGDAQAAAALAVTIPSNLKTLMSSTLKLTTVKWEQRDVATNHLEGVSVATSSPGTAGTGTNALPAQSSVVFSLRTDTPGASGRGRMYWPGVGAGLSNSTLRLTTPGASVIVADAKTYLNSIAAAILAVSGGPFTSLVGGVYSQRTHSIHPITRIQVGDVIDTQRRRRDSLPEVYSTVTFP